MPSPLLARWPPSTTYSLPSRPPQNSTPLHVRHPAPEPTAQLALVTQVRGAVWPCFEASQCYNIWYVRTPGTGGCSSLHRAGCLPCMPNPVDHSMPSPQHMPLTAGRAHSPLYHCISSSYQRLNHAPLPPPCIIWTPRSREGGPLLYLLSSRLLTAGCGSGPALLPAVKDEGQSALASGPLLMAQFVRGVPEMSIVHSLHGELHSIVSYDEGYLDSLFRRVVGARDPAS